MKRTARAIAALALLAILAGVWATPLPAARADSVVADNFRYIPTSVTYAGTNVRVTGFFVNFNPDATLSNLRDLSISLYDDDNRKVAGTDAHNAENLRAFTLAPLRCAPWTFNISDVDNPGRYSFGNRTRVGFTCRFSYSLEDDPNDATLAKP